MKSKPLPLRRDPEQIELSQYAGRWSVLVRLPYPEEPAGEERMSASSSGRPGPAGFSLGPQQKHPRP